MYITTTGLVLREVAYKESSRILTVLTPGEGRLTVSARGARRRGSKVAAATGFLAFSEMTLLQSRDRWTLTEARSLELFEGLRDGVELLALGAYIAETAELLCAENVPAPQSLALCLNSLFALSEKQKPPEIVKPAFELRMMEIAGFAPALDGCAVCGRTDVQEPALRLRDGELCCAACARTDGARHAMKLTAGTLDAMRYILTADAKKIFSFSLGDAALRNLGAVCEAYMAAQLDYSSKALDYYERVAGLTEPDA